MKPARPYICLLIILVLVLTPSVRPLWCGRVSAAVAAWMSRSRPRVNECTWGRSAVRAPVIHWRSLASLPGSGASKAAKDVMRLARAVISGQAVVSPASVSCCPAVRRSGLVSRIRAARRGDRCGRSLSRRPWLM